MAVPREKEAEPVVSTDRRRRSTTNHPNPGFESVGNFDFENSAADNDDVAVDCAMEFDDFERNLVGDEGGCHVDEVVVALRASALPSIVGLIAPNRLKNYPFFIEKCLKNRFPFH